MTLNKSRVLNFVQLILVPVISAILIAWGIIFFLSGEQSWDGPFNYEDGHYYVQMKGRPQSFGGFTLSNQQVPDSFYKVMIIDREFVTGTGEVAEYYVYFDQKIVTPLFWQIFLIAMIVTGSISLIFVITKHFSAAYFFNDALLIFTLVVMIGNYFFWVPWN